ncbi:glutamic acid-rich protein-like [Leptopilina boulardi]|uniref:glutamic acid-rich protein-like n=1 Tax=Leptopilina boulardi TaxID=63433 RepID=UPI0021F5B499|nr:glutamic acid-rich protein-like [Leptopilina boulardi]
MPGKIYVLLQWVDKPNAITIMEETEDAKKANEEEIIQIKYPNKGVFKAILLHRSESKSFLEKLSKNVNKDGTITAKKKNTSKIEKFKSQSAKEKAESKLKKKMRAQTASKLEDKISEIHPICEDKRKKTTDSAVKNILVNDFDDNQKDNGMNNEKIDVVTVNRNNLDSSDLEHVKTHSTLDKESEKPSKFNNKNKKSSRIEDKRKKTTDSTSKDISVTDSDDNHEDNGISHKKIDIVTMNEDNLDASEPENVETHLTLENESEKSSKFNKTKKSSRIGDLGIAFNIKIAFKNTLNFGIAFNIKVAYSKSPSTLELTSTSKSSLINELSLTSGLSLSDEFPSTSVTPEFVNGLEILLKFAKTVVDKNVEVNSPEMDEKEVVEDNKVDHSDEGNEEEDSQDENSEREDSQEYNSDREDSQEQDSEEENENDHEEPLAKKRKL